jgi:catechol 2,3-dioxygenase-like lactoylglutathione lyase family enzyme
MITGAHMVLYSKDATADRAFFRDILGFAHVDAGDGWLIFAMPPAEMAIHPADENDRQELFFMCKDLKSEMAALATRRIECSEVQEARWGLLTKIRLPGGGRIGLYQPKSSNGRHVELMEGGGRLRSPLSETAISKPI